MSTTLGVAEDLGQVHRERDDDRVRHLGRKAGFEDLADPVHDVRQGAGEERDPRDGPPDSEDQ